MEQKIEILQGPERVRRRPAVIFGSQDASGVLEALGLVVKVLLQGGCGELVVTRHTDGSLEVQDDGPGLYLADGQWELLFCALYPGPKYGDPEPPKSLFEKPAPGTEGPDSLELCAVQCASAWMDVQVIRDGLRQRLHFEKGYNLGGLTTQPTQEKPGTRIRFLPDGEVFTDIALSAQAIEARLAKLGSQYPATKLRFA